MILVFDTSTASLSIGLGDDAGVLLASATAEASETERGIHDARLALATSRLLKETRTEPTAITRIGLVIGPGSFTGLRIGLAFAKGLAFATGAEILPVTQHELLAEAALPNEAHLVTPGYQPSTLYHAKRQEPRDIRLISETELDRLTQETGGDLLAHTLLAGTLKHPARFHRPSAEELARITARATQALGEAAISGLEPLYLTEFTPGASSGKPRS